MTKFQALKNMHHILKKANGDFSDGVSIEQNRREGLERASYSMATKVVTQLAEGW